MAASAAAAIPPPTTAQAPDGPPSDRAPTRLRLASRSQRRAYNPDPTAATSSAPATETAPGPRRQQPAGQQPRLPRLPLPRVTTGGTAGAGDSSTGILNHEHAVIVSSAPDGLPKAAGPNCEQETRPRVGRAGPPQPPMAPLSLACGHRGNLCHRAFQWHIFTGICRVFSATGAAAVSIRA
jgi:hypothetical protein